MTKENLLAVPGVTELLGRGIYTSLPENLAEVVRDQRAVIVGRRRSAAAAAARLRAYGCGCVTVGSSGELACAAGVERLEAVVLKRARSGRIEAVNADALFVLPDGG